MSTLKILRHVVFDPGITVLLTAVLCASLASAAHGAFGPVTDLGWGTEPHCALGLGGTLHVVFRNDNAVQYLTMDGGVPSALQTLPGSGGGRNPFICVGTDGSVHVVWDTWSTAYYTNRVGGYWKNPLTLPFTYTERNYMPQVAVASNGVAYTSHWSLTKDVGGHNVFCRVTNTGSSTPTITKIYQETSFSRPPSIIGPSPASAGTGNIHIFIGLPQTVHRIMDSDGNVSGGTNISRTPWEKTTEGMQGYFVGTDPGIATAWWDTTVEGAVVNTLSRANAGKQGLIAGIGSLHVPPYPRAAYDPVGNRVYILYPQSNKPALASWNPQQDTVQQLGYVTESNLSSGTRGPGAGGIAVCAGGGVNIVYSTGGRVYHRTNDAYDADDEPPTVPTDVSATTLSATSIRITWTASTDNVGVAGYRIYRDEGGAPVAATPGDTTFYDDTGLLPETLYSYRVSAFDAALNESGQSSPPATATTDPEIVDPTPSDPNAHNWHQEFTHWSGSGGTSISDFSSSTGGATGSFSLLYLDPAPTSSELYHDATNNRCVFNVGSTSKRFRFGSYLAGSICRETGAAVGWRMEKTGTNVERAPFQFCLLGANKERWTTYISVTGSQIIPRMNGGAQQPGVDPLSYSLSGMNSYALAGRDSGGWIYWKLWVNGTLATFIGSNGGSGNTDPWGQNYSFRSEQDGTDNDTPANRRGRIGLGELHKSTHWGWNFEWVRWTDQGDVYFGEPYFHGHPADEEQYAGETATFSVATWSEGTVSYQWQVKAPGGGWNNIDGATGPSYTTDILTTDDDGNQYRCRARRGDWPFTYSQPATLTVTAPPCEDPVLLSAYSVMTHGPAGDFAIGIELDEPYAIEPRAGAEHRLEFVFDQAIDKDDAVVLLSSGTVGSLSLATTDVANDTLVGTLAEPPDNNACLTIDVSGVTDFTGLCEMTPVTVYLTMIQGEVDGSPPVNLTDLSIVRAQLYQPVTEDNFMSDVNADGVINLTDLSLVRDNLYQQAACP